VTIDQPHPDEKTQAAENITRNEGEAEHAAQGAITGVNVVSVQVEPDVEPLEQGTPVQASRSGEEANAETPFMSADLDTEEPTLCDVPESPSNLEATMIPSGAEPAALGGISMAPNGLSGVTCTEEARASPDVDVVVQPSTNMGADALLIDKSNSAACIGNGQGMPDITQPLLKGYQGYAAPHQPEMSTAISRAAAQSSQFQLLCMNGVKFIAHFNNPSTPAQTIPPNQPDRCKPDTEQESMPVKTKKGVKNTNQQNHFGKKKGTRSSRKRNNQRKKGAEKNPEAATPPCSTALDRVSDLNEHRSSAA